jgi:phenylacetate-CoA ligase
MDPTTQARSALLFQPRAAIRQHQLTALRELLATVLPTNAFQRHRLSAVVHGCAPGSIPEDSPAATGPLGVRSWPSSLDEFTALLPFTTKAELVADQQAHPPLGTNLTYPIARYTRLHQTSGTAGAPLRWLDCPESWQRLVECWCEVLRAAGVGPNDRVFFAFSFGPFIGFWLAFEAAETLGALCIPGGGLTSIARLHSILETRSTVLCSTPTYALHLAEVAHRHHLDLHSSRVRTLIVAGEPGGSIPATRSRLEQLWPGARVFDHHGMTEVGPVTFECPVRPGILHIIESAFLAEIIDPATGLPLPAGKRGELVLTPLHRPGSPLVRYRTGDLVQAVAAPTDLDSPPCACGRYALALQGGILGRADDMVIIRGVNVFPSAVEAVLHRFADVAEYQVRVDRSEGLAEIDLRIEPTPNCADPEGLVRSIAAALETTFALRIPVRAVSPNSLPRFELKARRWISAAAA